MNNHLKDILKNFSLFVIVLAFLNGCNTIKGMGQDIQAGGKAISKVASGGSSNQKSTTYKVKSTKKTTTTKTPVKKTSTQQTSTSTSTSTTATPDTPSNTMLPAPTTPTTNTTNTTMPATTGSTTTNY